MPEALAWIGAPIAVAILMPSLWPPVAVAPKSEITRPDTGQAKDGALAATAEDGGGSGAEVTDGLGRGVGDAYLSW